jgi:putative sterol carrier protein
MAVKFLSEEWVEALKSSIQASDEIRAATRGKNGRVLQIVNTDGAPILYWVSFADGEVDMGMGNIDDPTITVTTSYETAAALAQGNLSATAAFMSGKVDVSNVMTAMGFQGVLSKFGDAVKAIDAEF